MDALDDLQVAIIDYEMGNLFSVKRACEYVGLNPIITSDKFQIINSDGIILPGVGAFGDAMDRLKRLDLISPIKEFVESGKPFMGVCLGMQLLLSESEEFGNHKGLNIIEGSVVRFPFEDKSGQRIKVPQVGWNNIVQPLFRSNDYWSKSPLKDIKNGEFMYFVHSYYTKPVNSEVVLSNTIYEEIEFCSSILYKNVFAAQYHPEKSGLEGLKIYRNWVSIIKKPRGVYCER